MARPVITLITDFGMADPFVGTMKGVILGICPDAEIVDLTHDVPAQDIRAGAYLLSTAYLHFPHDTTHVAIVDPGVGTQRRPIAVKSPDATFVCPDNGLLSYVLTGVGSFEARHLTTKKLWLPNTSLTFHGRDIFAPVAAHLASGISFESIGPVIDGLVFQAIGEPHVAEGQVLGGIVHIDIYGNLVTNIKSEHLPIGAITIEVMDCEIDGLSQNYQDGKRLVALIGSSGSLEIALRSGSAATEINAGVGASVWVRTSA